MAQVLLARDSLDGDVREKVELLHGAGQTMLERPQRLPALHPRILFEPLLSTRRPDADLRAGATCLT